MLTRLNRNEQGFTLIELLVVILIIGILTAVALPTFLGQQKKAQDSSAKSDARNIVSHVESCFAGKQTYVDCDTAGDLGTTGLSWGAGQGQVSVIASAVDGYTIEAVSHSGNKFRVVKAAGGAPTRECDTDGDGGCKADGSW